MHSKILTQVLPLDQESKADKKDNSQDNVENVDYEVVDDDK